MIKIKKIVSLMMSVLLVASSIAAPSFAADGESARLIPGTSSIADHENGEYAYMEAADTLSGSALRIAGSPSSDFAFATKYIKYPTPQDWSHYNYLNLVIKNAGTTAAKVFAFLDLSDRSAITGADGTMYYKSFTPTGSDWNLISFPLDDFSKVGGPTGRSEITGFCFAQNLNGDAYLDAVWLSEEQVTPTVLESTSEPDVSDGVIADSPAFTFTYSNDLAPQDKQNAEISFTDGSGAPVEYDVTYSGNTLTVEPKGDLELGESYSLSISGVRDCFGIKLANITNKFNPGTDEVVPSDDFDTITARWKKSLVGDDSLSAAVPQNYLNAIKTAANTASGNVSTTATFTLLDNFRPYFENLEKMAIGYATEGVELDDREAFFEKIEAALAHALTKYCRGTDLGGNNWYNYMVGAPRALINILIILEDELDPAIMEDALDAIEFVVPDVDKPSAASMYAERGSNCLYYAKIRIGTTLLRHDAETFAKFLAYFQNECNYADTQLDEDRTRRPQQGFYPDGTYLYHTRHFLNGTYGAEHFEMLPEIAAILKDTDYEIDSDETENILEIYHNGFEPFIYDGTITPMVTGRAPYDASYDSIMPRIMKTLVNMITLFDGEEQYSEECAQLKQKIKQYYSANTADLNALPIELYAKAYAIVNDNSISAPATYTNTKIYNFGDKAVHHTDSFMAAISMSSSRVYNYESLHDGYTKGWYMGDGMQYIYMDGDTQYNKAWFRGSDPYKRPGTTVDTQERVAAKIAQGKEYLSSKDFVGGVALGNTGVAAMDLESYHKNDGDDSDVKTSGSVAGDSPNHTSTLTAKKSWFMFDDEIVSMGTDITANDGYEVLTVLDNRYLPDNDIYVKGTLRDPSTQRTYSSVEHLNYGNKIGYVFPVYKESVTVKANGSYVETWLSHGTNPSNISYEYITLPCKTNEETIAYAEDPDVQVLSNTSSVQAVKDNSTNTTGYVFWQAATLDGISAANPCTVVKKVENDLVTMAVSDPTHKLATITLTLNDTDAVLVGTPENVTFEQTGGNTVITIEPSDFSGQGYEFSFRVPTRAYVKSVELTTQGSDFSADFTIANPLTTPANLTVYLAIYDSKEEKLLNVISKDVPVATEVSDTISLPKQTDCVAKLFVWEGYVPLDRPTTLTN
ncbi:MAG: Ig-like domain-containing protein [Clostridia bacterium]|nr:Ig-like domain-containing protein [Clostridia bacterium]